MKTKKLLGWLIGAACSLSILSGCMAGMFEEEIKVTFATGGEVIGEGTVTQFKNIKSPELEEGYIPADYKFLGWTCKSEAEIDTSNVANFKKEYIAGGRMVHYMEVKPYAVDHAVTMEALIMHKDDIPKEYHYVVMAWYDKPATSGITEEKMAAFESNIKSYFASKGVSQEDIDSVVIRPYTGNVGPSTGQILFDGDVDIMFGWGSVQNVTETGSIKPEMILQTESYPVLYQGTAKNRTVHRLSDSVGSLALMEYLMSDAAMSYWNS